MEAKTSQKSAQEVQLQNLIQSNADIVKQIEDIKNQEMSLSLDQREILENKISQLDNSRQSLADQIVQLQRSLANFQPSNIPPSGINVSPSVRIVPKSNVSPTLSLSDQPNVVSGLVKDLSNQPVVGAIVLINDHSGKPVRALKTNKIGQFITNTPLENGTYYLEIEKEGTVFDTTQIMLSGQIVPILEIRGRFING
jgi:hypothetical protein